MGKGYYRDIHQQYVLYILSSLVSTALLVHSNVRQLIWEPEHCWTDKPSYSLAKVIFSNL